MKSKEKDYIMRTVGCQTIVSLVILAIVFCISKTSSDLLSRISKDILPLITVTLTREEADNAFKSIREILYSDDILGADNIDASQANTSQEDNADTAQSPDNTEQNQNAEETSVNSALNSPLPDINDVDLIATVNKDKSAQNIKLNITRDGEAITASASTLTYSLNMPVYKPLSGKITDKFGNRIHPVYKTKSFHTGIDIAGDTGEYIRSIADGTVIRAAYDQWNGNYIEIDHGNGITTMYCHCSKLLCKVGTVVRGGEAIARVGSTGVSTGPHLHFEFRIDGVSYNPVYALKCGTDEV